MMLSAVHPAKSSSTSSPVQAAWPKPLAKYENDLLTVDNMAEVLDTSSRTIYRLVEKGELPYVKVGRRLYFPKCQVIEALQLGEAM